MKIGDLVARKSHNRLYKETTPPLMTVVRVIKSAEPRLQGRAPYYITFADDPGRWRDPQDFFVVSPA